MYSAQVTNLLADLEASHSHFYHSAVFGGPSFYFHQRALADGSRGDVERFAESSYAMLVAWGMHRMGKGGAKMTDFETYADSLRNIWPVFVHLENSAPRH
jgi:hypothetical protein